MKLSSKSAQVFTVMLSLCGALYSSMTTASSLALSDTPLGVSIVTEPNVMFLIDNSGSMNNIIWDANFDPTTVYSGSFNSSTGNYTLGCSGGCWVSAQDSGGTWKQLFLPDPVGGGNTRYTGNYLNYLFNTFSDGTNLNNGLIPNDYRMNVARNVATALVQSTPGMRFGVSRFYGPYTHDYGHGATVDAACGSSTSTIASQISGYTASTNTPLAEALYELTRYFRGLSSYYHSGVQYSSPVQYRCQKNFTIIITDGLPTRDTTIPNNDPADVADTAHSLPDWDGLDPATQQSDYPNFPQYSDGFQPDGNESNEGYSLYLDDIAKFAIDIDLMPDGTQNDDAGASFNDPLFTKQTLNTYTVGFSIDNQMLQDAAEYGEGQYFTASNTAQLTSALQSVLADIAAKTSSSASVAQSTGSVSSDTRLYQARYRSSDWSGQLLSFKVDSNVTSTTYGQLLFDGTGPEGSVWDAGSLIPAANSRTIITSNGTSGVPFRWNDISGTQQTTLGNADLLGYLRGDKSNEQSNGGTLRNRSTLLGDIVHSSPQYVGSPPFRYTDDWDDFTTSNLDTLPEDSHEYSIFKATYSGRSSIVYTGANDGMLHAFDTSTGIEKLAYIPTPVFNNLPDLASPNYQHQYFVDGTPTAGDVVLTNNVATAGWYSVLTGGLGKGGQGIYALDITDPDNFSESSANNLLLWEFTDSDDPDLGYTYSRPAIVRMHNDKWAIVFGNGYNNTEADGSASTSGHAVLYVLFIEDGLDGTWDSGDFIKIDTMAGSTTTPNGLATVAPVDKDGDFIIDYIYAGDLQGNMWKFNVENGNPSKWVIPYGNSTNPSPLFTACSSSPCTSNNRQPITTKPMVGRHPKSQTSLMVYFGTGKYIENGDNLISNAGIDTFYAVEDRGATTGSGTRTDLLQQEILWQGSATFDSDSYELRVTSNNGIDWNSHNGWYIDLTYPSGTVTGERVVFNPLLRDNRIIFTTLIPGDDDPCTAGSETWLWELDSRDGSRLGFSPFDLYRDRTFNSSDFVTVTINGEKIEVPVSAKRLSLGGGASPAVLAGQNTEFKYVSGAAAPGAANGGVDVTTESPGKNTGRQSWRQLR